MKNQIICLSLGVVLIFSLSACNTAETIELKQGTIKNASKPTAESLRTELESLSTEINNIIGTASCSNSKQCGALPMGQKACGGPMTYIPYSTENTDTTKLIELSDQHQQKNKELNQLTGMMSDCMMVMPPAFICRDNRCQK